MQKTKKIVAAALFAALTCVATMAIRIPTPGTGGYIHPGDAVVILCGVFLSPGSAFLAAGLGSCLADLLGGYMAYVPVTFAIKGLSAFLGSHVFQRFAGRTCSPSLAVIFCGLADVVLVAGGYWLFESILYGPGAALASVPPNLIQGAGGLIMAAALFQLLKTVPDMGNLKEDKTRG